MSARNSSAWERLHVQRKRAGYVPVCLMNYGRKTYVRARNSIAPPAPVGIITSDRSGAGTPSGDPPPFGPNTPVVAACSDLFFRIPDKGPASGLRLINGVRLPFATVLALRA